MLYSSVENKKIKEIKKLNEKKYRDKYKKFIIEGDHVVNEAYKKGILEEVLLDEGIDLNIDVKKSYVTTKVLKYISNLDNPPKVVGICNKTNKENIGQKVMILDNIQDPGNLGTIIRSCVAFNIDTLILGTDSVDVYNPKVLRATQGMIFNLNIIQSNLIDIISVLKKRNYKIYGTKVNCGKSLKNVERCKKFAIIMGNEGNGVKKEVLSQCDDSLYIEINKNCESLNVGVAASIILYELDK